MSDEEITQMAPGLIQAFAAKEETATEKPEHVIKEIADLWFHSIVLLHHLNASARSVSQELEKRLGISGLQEKASRKR